MMGTGIYGTKYDKSGTFGLEVDGSNAGFPSYCMIQRGYRWAIETAFNLAQEGTKVTIWAECQDCCVDIFSKQY